MFLINSSYFPIFRSGRKRITCKFEKELDAILGSRPTTRPSMVVDTGTNSEEEDGEEEKEDEEDTTMTLEESINTGKCDSSIS